MATLVYRYGTRNHYELPDEAVEQLYLANRLWNRLVELTRNHDKAMNDLWSQYPAVADAEQRLTQAEQQVEELARRARVEHVADRTVATRPATAAELKEARAAVKAAREARRAAIKEAYLLAKPRIEQLRAEHKAAIKSTYAEFVQQQGLYWATYNAVREDHKVAVKRVTDRRKQGQPAELRFHRWTGEGTISVQLQRTANQPPRTPSLLASGEGSWRNVFQLRPYVDEESWAAMTAGQRRRAGRGEARMCIGGGRMITIPVQVHRMMPADADVVAAQLTRRRVAGKWVVTVAVTARVPDPEPVTSGPAIAFHLGWRALPDGGVRVATWAASAPITVPDRLADVVTAYDGGRWGEVVIRPYSSGLTRWAGAADHPDKIRSVRDMAFEPVRDQVAAWLDQHPQPDPRPDDPDRKLTGAQVRAWRSHSRLAALALRWRESPPVGEDPPLELLEAWRRQDRHLWEGEAHERAQVTAARDYTWQQVGAWIGDRAGLLLVDDTDLQKLRRREDEADADPVLPGEAAAAARARAALLAPGRLRQLVVNAATRRGVSVQVVPAAGLTRTHVDCGHVAARDARYAASAVVVCPGCGGSYDQDRNAALLMLVAVSEPAAAVS